MSPTFYDLFPFWFFALLFVVVVTSALLLILIIFLVLPFFFVASSFEFCYLNRSALIMISYLSLVCRKVMDYWLLVVVIASFTGAACRVWFF